MAIFLIDYENVRTSAFNGLENLTKDDRVIVFYTSNSDNLTFSLMQRLSESRACIEYKKVSCGGKNSLDFQLCSYLGYLIGTCSDTKFHIVSKDKGFFSMISLWGESTCGGNSVVCCANMLAALDGEKNDAAAAELDGDTEEKSEDESPKEEPAPRPKRRRTYKRKTKASDGEQSA